MKYAGILGMLHDEFFIGSADWMKRNLDRRVETVAPLEGPVVPVPVPVPGIQRQGQRQ